MLKIESNRIWKSIDPKKGLFLLLLIMAFLSPKSAVFEQFSASLECILFIADFSEQQQRTDGGRLQP